MVHTKVSIIIFNWNKHGSIYTKNLILPIAGISFLKKAQ